MIISKSLLQQLTLTYLMLISALWEEISSTFPQAFASLSLLSMRRCQVASAPYHQAPRTLGWLLPLLYFSPSKQPEPTWQNLDREGIFRFLVWIQASAITRTLTYYYIVVLIYTFQCYRLRQLGSGGWGRTELADEWVAAQWWRLKQEGGKT